MREVCYSDKSNIDVVSQCIVLLLDSTCVALNCSISPPLNNSQLQSSCDTQYQSTCTTACVDGYTGVGGSYTCVVTDEDTNGVRWYGSTSCLRTKCCGMATYNNYS